MSIAIEIACFGRSIGQCQLGFSLVKVLTSLGFANLILLILRPKKKSDVGVHTQNQLIKQQNDYIFML